MTHPTNKGHLHTKSAAELQEVLRRHQMWRRCDSGGVRADLSKADLYSADLSKADLYSANLRKANLTGANLTGANLTDANLRKANLTGANLTDADLAMADLTGANLRGAELAMANLRGADLRGAELRGADLTDANLRGVDLRGTGIMRLRTSYEVTVYPDDRMTYGCETRTCDEWLEVCDERARLYHPEDPDRYANEIRAIIAMARNRSTLP